MSSIPTVWNCPICNCGHSTFNMPEYCDGCGVSLDDLPKESSQLIENTESPPGKFAMILGSSLAFTAVAAAYFCLFPFPKVLTFGQSLEADCQVQ
jgi:hypothetical protein